LFSSTLPEHFNQFSQELRLTSPTDGPIEYLVGAYYQRDHIDGQAIFTYSFLAPAIAANPTFRPLGAYSPFSHSDHYLQTTDTLAGFGALTWKLADNFRIVGGIRSSGVKKDFEQTTFFGTTPGAFGEVTPFPTASLNTLAADFAARLRLGIAGTRTLSRTDRHTSPSVTVQYSPTGDMMLYGSYVNGFKSGGFNATEHSGQPNTLAFDPEKVDAFEIGAKTQWLDRRLTFDVALFYNKYDGLQASASQNSTGAILAVVRNVGGAISKGAEIEARWVIDSHWTAGLSLSLLDSYYSSYPNAGAPPILVARGQSIVDLTDHKTRYAPDYSGNLAVGYLTDLGDYRLGIHGDWFFSGKYNYSNNDDPLLVQGAYAELDMSLTLGRPSAGWELSVIGKNVTDRTVVVFGTAVPSTPGSYYVAKEPPRSTSLQLRYKF
jgi:outer membrane receptor protein involved in Fe transport